MAAQKCKKNLIGKFSAFLNSYYPKTHPIKALNSLDSSRPYGRLLKNQKTEGSRELFLPENNFQTSYTKHFPKKNIEILKAWQPTEDMKFRLEIFFNMPFYI